MNLGSRLNALWHLIQDIGSLMNPATLLYRFRKLLPKGCPESQAAVTNRQLRTFFKPPLLEIAQHLLPSLFALPVSVKNGNKLFPPVFQCPHNDQDALPVVLRVFQTNIEIDAVNPEINVTLMGEIVPGPILIILLPESLE